MTKDVKCLSMSCSTLEMLQVLRAVFPIPVIDAKSTHLLHGTVSRETTLRRW